MYDAGGTADIKEDNIAWTRMASSRSATEKVMVQKQAPPQMNVVIYGEILAKCAVQNKATGTSVDELLSVC